MPRRKDTPLPERPTIPLAPSILVARSLPLQQIVHILLNGSHNPQFTPHAGLVRLIWNAYERMDTEGFLRAVQTYLEQAVAHVAQSGRPEDIPRRLTDLTELIEQAGLAAVAKRLLSVVYASPL